MATSGREDQGVLDSIDSMLVRAIHGAFWFPLGFVPRVLQRVFPTAVKLARVCVLFAVWAALVFWPLAFLDEVSEPFVGMFLVSWTVLAAAGSVWGILRVRRASSAAARTGKPADLAEAFV